jgi:hypothetical protein
MDTPKRYSWDCEKCGEHQESNHNVCKTCKQVYFNEKVICDRCGKAPVGNSDFGSARALRTLTMGEVLNPNYGIFKSAAFQSEFFQLFMYVGQRLCRMCHPDGFSSGTGITSKFYLAEEQDPEIRKAYQDLADRIKRDLEGIKKENPKINENGLMRAARYLMRTKYKKALNSDIFEYERLETRMRKAIHKSVPSNTFLRKLTKDELHEPILRPDYDRIEAARQTMDLTIYTETIKDETKKANERVKDLFFSLTKRGGGKKIDSAGRGGGLIDVINQVEEVIERKFNEIDYLKEQLVPAEEIEAARSAAFDRTERLKAKLEKETDPLKKNEIGILLSRAQVILTEWSRKAEHSSCEELRQRIDRIMNGIFTMYRPLLESARNIIDWDPIGKMMTDEVRSTPFSFYPLSAEHIEDENGERVWDIDLDWPEQPDIEHKTCEVCRTKAVLRLMPIPVTRYKVVEGEKQDIVRPMSAAQASKCSKAELKKSTITLAICQECQDAPDVSVRHWDDHLNRKYVGRIAQKLIFKQTVKDTEKETISAFKDQYNLVLSHAVPVIREKLGIPGCVGALWRDEKSGEHELWIVGVGFDDKYPKTIRLFNHDINLAITSYEKFPSAYLWAILGPKQREKWMERAKSKGKITYRPDPDCDFCFGRGKVLEVIGKDDERKVKKPKCICIKTQIKYGEQRTTFMEYGQFGLVYGKDRWVHEPDAIASILGLEVPIRLPEINPDEIVDSHDLCPPVPRLRWDAWPIDYWLINDPEFYCRVSYRQAAEAEAKAVNDAEEKHWDLWASHYSYLLAKERLAMLTKPPLMPDDEAECVSLRDWVNRYEEGSGVGGMGYCWWKDVEYEKALTPPPKGGFHQMKKLRTFPIMMVGRRAMKQDIGFKRHIATEKEIEDWKREKAAEALKNRKEFERLKEIRASKAEQLGQRKRVVVRLPKRKKSKR